ncbi:restriction endonuclease subunit S [bacterium]|nr:restriction endonuclease subunit S [bacterium]
MTCRTIKIGDIVEQYREICLKRNLTPDDVWGISAKKEFFSPARQIGQDTSGYKIVSPGCFACNLLHVGRDKVLPIALNRDDKAKIVSFNYYVFKFKDNPHILKEYFFLLLFSEDMDRYFSYHTESSVRDRVDWKTFCSAELKVPPIDEQKRVVDVFLSLRENIALLKKYNNLLKRLISAVMEEHLREAPTLELGEFITKEEVQNSENLLGAKDLYGISADKTFCASMTDVKKVNLSAFFIVKPKYFAYNEITSRNKESLSLAFNITDKNILVSNRYRVFKITSDKIIEEFLYLYFTREEFNRFARFSSWGCAREMFEWSDFIRTKIPVPPLLNQKILADLFYLLEFKKKKLTQYEKMAKRFSSLVFKKYSD